ncbi:MAG: Gfo/Idh/MocA family oxidoreductase [Phycisphaerae bacterium]|nr:Gfo/Idh/MocA family oxidoreductase [Phycisphaerae bacterium]
MTRKKTRREFLRESASVAAAGLWLGGGPALGRARAEGSPNDKLNVAVVGVANQGEYNLNNVASQNIVALCDVDENLAAAARKRFPKAKFYADFRKLLDQKDVEGVVIATPDHTHAPATMMALRAGKPVYCEKPLTHTVHEARQVTEMAAKTKLATQIGTQIHAGDNYRRVVELVQRGAVGPIKEIHVWVGGAWVGSDRPKDTPPIPKGLHYDEWLGPAPYRPYHPTYLPKTWRGWWDFGGGTLADMACHHLDLSHWALGLRHCCAVEAEGPPVHPESAPAWLIVRYTYPPANGRGPMKLTWYEGDKRPPILAQTKFADWGAGTIFVGEEGMLIANYGEHHLLPEEKFKDYKRPEPFIAKSIGHHNEWIQACKGGPKPLCSFDYSGPLTETVLLGNVAYRSGQRIEWDAKKCKIMNDAPGAEKFLRREYRKGWTL